jgi:hypothetical protein
MGDKSADKFIVPLCARCHRVDQHQRYAEPEFWARFGIDPLDFALQLYRNSGDDDAGLRTIARAQQAIRLHQVERA